MSRNLVILPIIAIASLMAAPIGTADSLLTDASWISDDTDATRNVAWGDWDGDGDLDLAAGNDAANRVYENDGGTLLSVWVSTETDPTVSVAWGDWDGDGDLDLATGNDGFPNRVYENDGLGNSDSLTLVWASMDTEATQSLAWGDWDSDGDLDLAVGNLNQVNRVYENDGLGNSTSLTSVWTSANGDATKSVAWADWDGDGDLDLAVGNANYQSNEVYENDGLGQSTSLSPVWSAAEPDRTISVAWGDWDGDGDFDLAIGNWDEANRVYINDGLGLPTSLTSVWTSGDDDLTVSMAWGDWDGDGDLDLAAGSNGTRRVYENDGLGLSTSLAEAWTTPEADNTQSVAWGDWDNDGDLDLVAGNRGQANQVYENDGSKLGSGSYLGPPELFLHQGTAWGDWNGDDDLDLAVGILWGHSLIYDNRGQQGLLRIFIAESDGASSTAWGDWDGDGDLDLAAAVRGQVRVYENDGLGNSDSLTLVWASAEMDSSRSVAWGDWDGDGDLDLAAGNFQFNRVYENDGLGLATSLTEAWNTPEADNTQSVAWGDWDNDGDLDLAAGNTGQANRVYENDGLGNSDSLTSVWTSGDDDLTVSMAWGDWDGDGDLDLAAGNTGQANRVYENDGLSNSNSLTSVWTSADDDNTASVAWGDWDGDGDLDLAAGGHRVYENDGLGLPTSLAEAWTIPEWGATLSVAWGDWDNDGDLDLAAPQLIAHPGSRLIIWRNNSLNRPGRYRLGRLPESACSPVLFSRPGTTEAAFFHSTAECLTPPIFVPFNLVDEEDDPARRIVAEYSLTGGGSWLPATEGFGGDGTLELAASPDGTPHVFVWDAVADGVLHATQVSFRISVTHQASTRLAGPVQRAAMAATSPPFRICETGVDLAVTKDNGVDAVVEGDTVAWTITVTNYDADAVTGARVTDTIPAGVTGVQWTCSAGPGASCGSVTGSGDIDELVDLEFESTVTFVAVGTATGDAGTGISNTATVNPPSGFFDTDPLNNSATDADLGWEIFADGFESG